MPGCTSPPTGFLQLLTWVDLSKGASVLQQTDSLAALRAALRGETIAAFRASRLDLPLPGPRAVPGRGRAVLLRPRRRDPRPRRAGAGAKPSSLLSARRAAASRRSFSPACFRRCARSARRETWDVVSLRPGKSPLRTLAEAFGTAPDNAGPAEIDAYLEKEAAAYRDGDADMLARIVDRRLDAAPEKPDRLLIYVDQWEELYAMAPPAEDKERRSAARGRRREVHRASGRGFGRRRGRAWC